MDVEGFVKEILEIEFGYSVTKIIESTKKSPDFLVEGYGERFLIELKTKEDDDQVAHDFNETLERDGIAEFSDTTGRKNTVSGLVRDACKQLSSIQLRVDFRLVWLMAVGRNQELKRDQFKSSLYGIFTVFDLESSHAFPCYYFGFNDFFAFKNVLDGAIISTEKEGELCLNTHSKNYSRLRDSVLAKKFGMACCDPVLEEEKQKAMIIDGDIDRKNQAACLAFLCEKYKRSKLQYMQMTYYSARALIPEE